MRKVVVLMISAAAITSLIVMILESRDCGTVRRWRPSYIKRHHDNAVVFRAFLANPGLKDAKLRVALDRLATWHERRERELRWAGSSSIAAEVTRDAVEMPLPGDFEARDWANNLLYPTNY